MVEYESQYMIISFTTIQSENVKHKRQFKIVTWTRNAESMEYIACNECVAHLTQEDRGVTYRNVLQPSAEVQSKYF